MKRLLLLMVVVGLFALGQGINAQNIENTGPGSNNTVTEETNNSCSISNSNQVDVDNSNEQNSSSGDANNDGNTNGGDSSTDDANNSSSTDTNVSTNNTQDCIVATNTETPAGGRGAGTPLAAEKSTAQVKTTPTGGVGAGSSSLTDMISKVTVLVGSIGALYFGFRFYGVKVVE